MDLRSWVEGLASRPEMRRKRAIGPVLRVLDRRGAGRLLGLGDDCGYLEEGGGYLLLTVDSMREGLLSRPRFAGFCAVNVSANDIYATGGCPLGVVDVMHVPEGDDAWALEAARGLREGCEFFGLEMLGGHLDAGASRRGLSVAALGRAGRVIPGFGAGPGDAVLLAFDPVGRWEGEALIWDSSSGRDPQRVLENYAVLPEIAENGLATSCRDVSNAGISGTLAMLAAACGVGAALDLDRVPRPEGVGLWEWLAAYPSYGFILTAPPRRAEGLEELFRLQGLAAGVCGEIREGPRLAFSLGGEEASVTNPLAEGGA
jgi:selenophosphate synthetase-related protein